MTAKIGPNERALREIGVPVHEMTDFELAEKQAMYRAMGAACIAHANELKKFQRDRSVA